jgi:site-specific DNA-cytosine methylase
VARRLDNQQGVARKSSFGHYEMTQQAGTLKSSGGDIGGGSENIAILSFPSRFGSNANVTEGQAQSMAHSAGAPAVLQVGVSYDGLNQKVEPDGAHRTIRIGRDSSDFVIAPGGVDDDSLLPVGLDSHRYRCCGNGVVAPVAEWIGRRIVEVDRRWREEGK